MKYPLSLGLFCSFLLFSLAAAAEPKIQILAPKDGSQVLQEQSSVLVSGKVSTQGERKTNVDLFFILDTSGSTAHYAGVAISDPDLPLVSSPRGRPQIGIFGIGPALPVDLRNSILTAEISAARRLLSQLNSETTRVGVITFAQGATVVQTLTSDFDQVRRSLSSTLWS